MMIRSVALLALTASSVSAFTVPLRTTTITTTTSSNTVLFERQPIMAGNWKMNPGTEEEAYKLAEGLTTLLGDETCPINEDDDMCTEVVIFPPHPFIRKVKDTVEEVGIVVGAQSIYWENKGAYTGEVSGSMIKSMGCEYILCGHSERRSLFSDDDDAINKKVLKVLESGLKPILCIGETKDEFDMDIRNPICKMQLSKDLKGVTKEQMANVVIAYEPVWAIGTGLVCGSEDANKVHKFLRSVLADLYDEEVAQATRIQYGGSVTPESVDELMAQPEIDGCLVGGASLVAEKFGRIINYQKK